MFWKDFWRRLSKKKPAAPPSGPLPSPKVVDIEAEEPASVEYWVDRLTTRLARLQRFRELDAPATFIEAELRLVDKAIARLGPGRTLSVMREWRELQRVIDPEAAAKRPSTAGRRYVEPN
jgi:hypothetical protein